MTIMTPDCLRTAILEYARRLPEGTLILADDLVHAGPRNAVAQELVDLAASGDLFGVETGIFVLPIASRFFGSGFRAPNLEMVLQAYEAQLGETITTIGAASANFMGVSTQVVAKPVYLTTGRSRHIALGGYDVELRHAPAWQTALGNSRPGHVIRAMAWMGAQEAREMAVQLMRDLSAEERDQLLQVSRAAPEWIAQAIFMNCATDAA